MELKPISHTELEALHRCEQVIELGQKTFVEVGNALAEIKEGKYYRGDYDTFDAYCKERWGFERRHAYRSIEAAKVVENVSRGTQSKHTPLPKNERQARPLTDLPPEKQAPAWQDAVDTAKKRGKPVTGRAVQDAVKRHKEPTEPPEEPKAQTKEEAPEAQGEEGAIDVKLFYQAPLSSPDETNPVASILFVLADGRWRGWDFFDLTLLRRDRKIAAWINESPSQKERNKRHVFYLTEDGAHIAGCSGEHAIKVTLNALVWLGFLETDGDGEKQRFRLLPLREARKPNAACRRGGLGQGVDRGNEAIDVLKRIPKKDALRKRGFQIVADWIKHNK